MPGSGDGDDEAVFVELFERTSARVYGYVRRHCDDAECDDIVSEVFLVAWRRLGDVPSDAVPWLLATARNVVGNHWRSRDRRGRLEAELRAVRQLAAGSDPAGLAVERAAMLAALATLSADDRELLLLVGWDGLDAAGAAQVLGCSGTAARARLSRARRALESALDRESAKSSVAPGWLLSEGN
jgi:RNA polymerase sigma-70 factor (ECF subfamily)